MRVAETRAVNRALRKAYGIGLCSIEEVGARAKGNHAAEHEPPPTPPTLRERLCELIRKHELDAKQVKAYALDFCGTQKLRDASRELIEDFISHLSARAVNDREALVADLARYAQPGSEASPAPAESAPEAKTEEVPS